jgi:TolB-like protein
MGGAVFRRGWFWVVSGAALAGAIGAAAWWARPVDPKVARAQQLASKIDRALERQPGTALPGVAVLPLAAPPDDKDLAYLGSALCDALVERLMRQGTLRLPSCASARVASETGLRGAQLAHLLDVDYAVEGALERLDARRFRARVTVVPLRGRGSTVRLDGEYDEERLQQLLDETSRRVLEGTGSQVPAASGVAVDAVAYAKYLRAMQLAARKNPDEMREALRLVEEALRIAPEYGDALYARLGLRSQLSQYAPPDGKAGTPEAMQAQQDALLREIAELGKRLVKIDPGHLRGNILLLNHAFQNRRWNDAFVHADALLAHVGRNPGVLRINARLYLAAGYLRRARELALDAARLDALNPETYEVLALVHGQMGDDRMMSDYAGIAEELGMRRGGLFGAMSALRRRDWPSFEKSLARWVNHFERGADWVPAYVAALADPARREEAARLLEAREAGIRSLATGYFLEFAMLGDTQRSLRAIQHHAQQAPAAWLEHLWWPELAPARRDAGFQRALADLALPALWRERGAPDLCRRAAEDRYDCS